MASKYHSAQAVSYTHLDVYKRQHRESTERQYALQEKAMTLGWPATAIRVLDRDLGRSGTQMTGREDFKTLVADVSMGQVGAVFAPVSYTHLDVYKRQTSPPTSWFARSAACGRSTSIPTPFLACVSTVFTPRFSPDSAAQDWPASCRKHAG